MNRLFLAQPVTLFDYEAIKDDFNDVLTGRWVPIQNLHLTLCFFADKFDEELLIEKLSNLQLQSESFELKGLECFGENKKILSAKIQSPTLQRLHTQIQEALGLPADDFIPHITLMRIKEIPHLELFEKRLHLYNDRHIGTLQPKIQLIQSQLLSQGSRYTLLKEF